MGTVSSHFVGGGGGLLMSLIAFSIVFLVIIGLMLLMMGLKYFVGIVNPGTGAATEKTPAEAKGSEAVLSQTPPVAAFPADEISADDELAAVITAAITAATGAAAGVLSFAPSRPGEIRAGHGMSAWKMTGVLSNNRGPRE